MKIPENRKPRPVDETWAIRSAAFYLERYASSVENLSRVLLRKAVRRAGLDRPNAEIEAVVETAVARIVELGLVNDDQFAEMKTASLRQRGASGLRISAKLSAKGVERDTIRKALDDNPVSEIEAAVRLAHRRRIGPWRQAPISESSQDARRKKERDIAALCRNGFSPEIARKVVDGQLADFDDL